jgi:hypothetical protein
MHKSAKGRGHVYEESLWREGSSRPDGDERSVIPLSPRERDRVRELSVVTAPENHTDKNTCYHLTLDQTRIHRHRALGCSSTDAERALQCLRRSRQNSLTLTPMRFS